MIHPSTRKALGGWAGARESRQKVPPGPQADLQHPNCSPGRPRAKPSFLDTIVDSPGSEPLSGGWSSKGPRRVAGSWVAGQMEMWGGHIDMHSHCH